VNDFGRGKQKLVKNNQDNPIENITLCNVYFLKKEYRQCTMGSGMKLGNFREFFVLEVTLQSVSVRLLLTVSYISYRKNGEAGFTSCCPNNFVGGFRTYGRRRQHCTDYYTFLIFKYYSR